MITFSFKNKYHAAVTGVSGWLIGAIAAAVLLLLWFPAAAQTVPQGAIELEQGARIWIEGSASIVDYKCTAQNFMGNGSIKKIRNPQQNIDGHGDVSVAVVIPVRLLECGKKKMNNDMYEALKAKRHKTITYRLIDARLVEEEQPSTDGQEGWMRIATTGVLQIAGVKDTTRMVVEGKIREDDRFRVKGSKQINMETYNIEPPTAMFGLIKASTKLTVSFDVTVRLKNSPYNAASLLQEQSVK